MSAQEQLQLELQRITALLTRLVTSVPSDVAYERFKNMSAEQQRAAFMALYDYLKSATVSAQKRIEIIKPNINIISKN